jgi:septum formation protein
VRYHLRMIEPGSHSSSPRHTGVSPEPRIVLASQSPRRRRLLGWLGLKFTATSVDTPEELDSPLARVPATLAASLAAEKAEAAVAAGHARGAVVLCFDTIVVHGGEVLGKPRDAEDARRMLRSLSGQTHQVVTGVALAEPGTQATTFAVTTDVRMRELDDARIAEWMARGEYLGCAGAYNIEAQVAEVTADECFQNVAGLPLCHLCAALRDAGGTGGLAGLEGIEPQSPIARCDEALGRTCRLGPRVIGNTAR